MKSWKKPVIVSVKAKELSVHIKAAARSNCWVGVFR